MALAVDASTPAFKGAMATSVTSASFTPPVGSLLVCCVGTTSFSGTPTLTYASTSLTFTQQVTFNVAGQGTAFIHTSPVGANGGSARTVQATTSAYANIALKVYVVTGQHATFLDITGTGSSTTNAITPTVLTTTVANCWVFGIGAEFQSLGVPTSTDTGEGYDDADMSHLCVRKSAATATASAVTLNFDAFGTGTAAWAWAAIAIRPDTGGAAVVQPPGQFSRVPLDRANLW